MVLMQRTTCVVVKQNKTNKILSRNHKRSNKEVGNDDMINLFQLIDH